jgi:branched-chain amino acid transport system substrate-binding protein
MGVAVASAAVLLIAGCGGGGPRSSEGEKLTDGKIVLGVLNDQSGAYSELSGKNSVKAVEMAVADFKAKHGDKAVTGDITVVTADHQNKPDVANTKAQELYDRQKADIIIDVPTSSAALAVASQAKAKQKLFINVGAGTTELTGAQCNKYTFHWSYDTYALAHGTGTTVTRNGGTNWQIMYPDYAFGQDMDKSFTESIEAAGGTVSGHIATPFPNDNFATFLTKAAADNPDVIGTMHAGGDLVNLVKQYNQAGLRDTDVELAVGLMFLYDIHSVGVDQFENVSFTDPWYWNFDDETREWADRFTEKTGVRPSAGHAGDYSAAMQYLEAVQAEGTDDSDAIVAHLEDKEIDDMFLRNGKIRAEDHRVIHDLYLARVKGASEVTEEWDYEEIVETIPAAEAFRPVEESIAAGCSMDG